MRTNVAPPHNRRQRTAMCSALSCHLLVLSNKYKAIVNLNSPNFNVLLRET